MKKRFAVIVSLALMLSLIAGPASVLAQDGGDEDVWLEFTSDDEMLTASYPPDWYAGESQDLPGLTVANSEAVLTAIMEGTDESLPASGDLGLQILLLPVDILTMSGFEITAETTLEELTTIVVEGLLGLGQDAETTTEFGEVEIVALDDEIEAGVMTVTDEVDESNGILVVYEVADGVIGIGVGLAFLGEYDADVEAAFYGVLASVTYEGTSSDLLALIMGDPTE